MAHPIPTIEGWQEPTENERNYMEYLDELVNAPISYGLLLFKGDPIAFRLGCQEWLDTTTFFTE